jgi:hypothetical protein
MVVPLVVDMGWWTTEAAVLTKALDEGAPKGKAKELWVTGKLSPRLVEELEARKWKVHQHAWGALYPEKTSSQAGEANKN